MTEEDEISICGKCGEKFPFSQGTAVYEHESVVFLCPACNKKNCAAHPECQCPVCAGDSA